MSDRLSELQRQRALIQGHLAWLDREIAREQGVPSKPVAPSSNSPLTAPLPAPTSGQVSESIITQFGSDTKNEVQGMRKGCFIVFGIVMLPALAALGYLIYQAYVSYSSRH